MLLSIRVPEGLVTTLVTLTLCLFNNLIYCRAEISYHTLLYWQEYLLMYYVRSPAQKIAI